MYKVFINEKKLILCDTPQSVERNIGYEAAHQFDMVLDLLQNTSTKDAAIFHPDVEALWADFKNHFKNIGAAGGIVVNPEHKILFIHRLGRWDLPKGKIEKGESNDIAAVREVEEECGITDLILNDYINNTFHIYTMKGETVLKTTHWFYMSYNASEIPKPQLEEGITEVTWKNASEIEKDVMPSTFQNIKLILEDFQTKFGTL